jgi:hypothetical protein
MRKLNKKPKIGDKRRTYCGGCLDRVRVTCTYQKSVDEDGKPNGFAWFCTRSHHD